MKRELRCGDKPVEIDSPEYPRAHEEEYSEAMEYMVDLISRRFRNQVLKALDADTRDKFEDGKPRRFTDANYAREYLKLAGRLRRKMLRQFDDDRIDRFTGQVLDKTNRHNRDQLYGRVEAAMGVSAKELAQTEGLTFRFNALELETSQWAKKLRDDTLEEYTANSLRIMAQGGTLEEILGQYDGMVEKRKNHAKFTARNQIANFNSIATKLRSQNLGLEEAIWITSRDERVRRCHSVRHNKVFRLDEGLYSSCDQQYLLPGVDYQCRCSYRIIVPND